MNYWLDLFMEQLGMIPEIWSVLRKLGLLLR